jgi:hypothetical protein
MAKISARLSGAPAFGERRLRFVVARRRSDPTMGQSDREGTTSSRAKCAICRTRLPAAEVRLRTRNLSG